MKSTAALFIPTMLLIAIAVTFPPAHAADDSDAGWTTLDVPGEWEQQADGRFAEQDGYAWYRCWVKIPDNWARRWDLTLAIDSVAGAYEVYFNGEQFGSTGSMPPEFQTSIEESRRITVPDGLVRRGEYNVLALRVHDGGDNGGFAGSAPAMIDYHSQIALEGSWQFRPGDDPAFAKAPADPPTDEVAYSEVTHVTAGGAAPTEFNHGERLPPEESMEKFSVSDDELTIEQLLTEPRVAQPLQLSFDAQGRLWVVQYRQYPFPAGLEAVSRDQYWRTVFDKQLPPPPYEEDSPFRGRDRITIHEDTDGDGKYDEHKTFLDGLNITTAIAHDRDGVWVLSPPQLLFYPDKNNDDKPDGEPEVHLTGFHLEDTHSVVNSLTWGPDGWLYAAQGSTVSGDVKRPGSEGEPVHSMGQNIWRYHPETGRYEIFAEGGGNAFGAEIDSAGRIYSGHNGGNARGFHYVQGGYYRKGFSKHGPLSNPYTFGYFPSMKHGKTPRFTHDFVIYEADALPAKYHETLIAVEPLQGRLVYSEMTPRGSTFATEDLGRPITSDDDSFRPVAIETGPDGALYVADFYEDHIAHGENFQGYLDPTSGRVYRVRAADAEPIEPFDLTERSTAELIDLLDHPNRWHRRTALRLIGQREDGDAVPELKELLHNNEGQPALEALWALTQLGALDEPLTRKALDHPNPHVRGWAVRLAGDDNEVTASLAERLAERAASEPNAEVRSQLACTARRLDTAHAMPIVRNLLKRDADADDPHLPLLLWWAIEAECDSDPAAVLKLFDSPSLWREPIVKQHIVTRLMRRFAATGKRSDLRTCAELLNRAPSQALQKTLLSGFEKALEGRTLSNPPDALVEAIAEAGGGSLTLRLRRRDPDAIDKALELTADASTSTERRRRLIDAFGEIQVDGAVPTLLEVFEGADAPALRRAALGALQAYEAPEIGRRVANRYPELEGEVRTAAQTLLASRAGWSNALAAAVEAGDVAPDAVPSNIVRQMSRHEDPKLQKRMSDLWDTAAGESNPAAKQQRITELRRTIRSDQGDPHSGKRLFLAHCGACHKMFGNGGEIGPELTSYQRDDLGRLLLNVVDPSAEIREGYEQYLIRTADGRTVTGFLTNRGERAVSLRDLAGQDITIQQDNIEKMQPLDRSLMPENLLEPLTDQQIRDLFAYLQAGQPLND